MYLFLFNVFGCFACPYMCTMCIWYPKRPEGILNLGPVELEFQGLLAVMQRLGPEPRTSGRAVLLS